jgi:hypothetical protein
MADRHLQVIRPRTFTSRQAMPQASLISVSLLILILYLHVYLIDACSLAR